MTEETRLNLTRYIIDNDAKGALEAINQLENVNFRITFKSPYRMVHSLMLACHYGNVSIVKALLKKGANTKVYDIKGNNPLHLAQAKNYFDIARLLVLHSPDLRFQTNNNDHSPLDIAAKNNQIEFLELYFSRYVNLHQINYSDYKEQRTALHLAVSNGHYEASRMLLEKGASTDSRDINNLSPYHLAEEKNAELASLLRLYRVPSLFTLASVEVEKHDKARARAWLPAFRLNDMESRAQVYTAIKKDAETKTIKQGLSSSTIQDESDAEALTTRMSALQLQ